MGVKREGSGVRLETNLVLKFLMGLIVIVMNIKVKE
jgi:hypothetical protein